MPLLERIQTGSKMLSNPAEDSTATKPLYLTNGPLLPKPEKGQDSKSNWKQSAHKRQAIVDLEVQGWKWRDDRLRFLIKEAVGENLTHASQNWTQEAEHSE